MAAAKANLKKSYKIIAAKLNIFYIFVREKYTNRLEIEHFTISYRIINICLVRQRTNVDVVV